MSEAEKIVDALKQAKVEFGIIKMSDDFRDLLVSILDKQVSKKPPLIHKADTIYRNYYRCPACDDDVYYMQNYCSECGQAFTWEGEGNAEE